MLRKLINSFKTDLETVKDMFNGEDYIKERFKQLCSWTNIKKDFSKHWIFFLLMLGFFLAGMMVSGKYYQEKCNQFIYTTYIEPNEIGSLIVNNGYNQNNSEFNFHPSISILPTPDG